MKTSLALLALASLAGVASAETGRLSQPLRVQVGVGFFQDGDNKASLNVGAGYDLYQSAINARGQYIRAGAHADFLFFNSGGVRTNVYSIGANGRFYFANTDSASFYAGAGLGVYFFDSRGFGITANDTKFGGRLALGAEFSRSVYADLGWNILPDNASYFTAAIGYKF